ncbi:hypothetical protein C1637_13145 [Chryseobacterium lactis]|uniref:DUF2306 domain-containing protein n=1 Tax=Chryseobacterium lactis TaxID=1241981 RepID=A0A3G6RMA4_CHRLC|nr:DUF2306 domain-containing protein [Chryseobacterium lactis]AZA83923.1 DUF2306 domain-containing protein [Chryseobacterium lactis]AZB04309.1 DUF2306 domain-containing protein [Chryseobacterium lactis]PNW12779.1 hypothetical protein C1637_13145 [Chryseobacterium lactis]
MVKSLGTKIVHALAIFSVIIFSILMLKVVSQYTSFEKNVAFLAFKQQVVNNPYWLTFFYIHIFSITLCLLAGLTQFSNQFLMENRKLHRIIGKIYVYNILIINVPACFVLGLFSNGGLIGITGFLIQDILWAYCTIAAVLLVKKGNIAGHRNYMILSYAVTTTAITFRIIKNLFYNEQYHDYQLFYGINVWLALFINVLIAYLVVKKSQNTLSSQVKIINKNSKDDKQDQRK